MTISLTQSGHGRNTSTATSYAYTLPAQATLGHKLIIAVCRNSGSQGLVTPTGWTKIVKSVGSSHEGALFYKDADGSETAVTVADSTGETDDTGTGGTATARLFEVAYCEVAGLAAGGPAGSAQTSNATGTSRATGSSGAPATADAFALAAVMTAGDVGASEALDNSFNLITVPASNRAFAGYKIVSDGTAQNPTLSWATSQANTARIAIFNAAVIPPLRVGYPRGLTRGLAI